MCYADETSTALISTPSVEDECPKLNNKTYTFKDKCLVHVNSDEIIFFETPSFPQLLIEKLWSMQFVSTSDENVEVSFWQCFPTSCFTASNYSYFR